MKDVGDDAAGWSRPYGDSTAARADRSWRNDFDVDKDRVLYSPEFRRLAGVTQVISPQEDYVFHDRLTHSLKVAQTAERLAQRLLHEYEQTEGADIVAARASVDPRVCYVAGLCHDLGHPPFGHAAEKQLQHELRSIELAAKPDESKVAPTDHPATPHEDQRSETVQVRDGFEGNAQSYRIVSRLSLRKDPGREPAMDGDEPAVERGLNLTWRSLAAISKYPWQASEGAEDAIEALKEREQHSDGPRSSDDDDAMFAAPSTLTPAEHLTTEKWGFYDSEADDMQALIRFEAFGAPESEGSYYRARSVEAEIMDWSDDIAYAVHDLEDFFRADRVPLARLRSDSIPEWEPIRATAVAKLLKYFPNTPREKVAATLSQLIIDHVLPQLPDNPFDGSRESHAAVQRFASSWIRYLQDATKLIHVDGRFMIYIEPDARYVVEALKAINVYYVIDEPTTTVMQLGQRRVVKALFESLLTMAVDVEEKSIDQRQKRRQLPARLEAYMTHAVETQDDDVVVTMARAVVDFICSLTDKQAGLLHQRITGDAAPRLSPYWLNV